ncbi:hypothetical protein [Sulfuricurvum sp.]|uniref:hypothetical protein n=1 Tax=Sulfuricurvum sp. TaxID=2025608 RepID=UPI003BAFB23D
MKNNYFGWFDMNDLRIDIRFKHDKPVDLVDMANSLIALNNLARTRIAKEHGLQDTKIMLKGVKEGSDLYQLVFAFGSVLPIMENFNTVASFTGYIKKYIELGNVTIDDISSDNSLTPESAKLMTTLINPIEIGNDKSSMSIEVKGDNNHVNIFNITAKDAEEIIKNAEVVQRIKSSSSDEKTQNKSHYEKVLISMHKTTNSDKVVKDRAYCDDIVKDKSIATIVENIEDRKVILNDPYNNYFLVDIEVNRAGDDVKLYRVTRLHKVIPIE